MRRRGVEGRRVSEVTTQLLAWLTAWWAAEGKTALLLVWDKASWHVRQAVRAWLKAHNRHVTQAAAAAGWCVPCRARALGAIGARPHGSPVSARLLNRIGR
jgi:hypothetical protein